MLCRRRPRRAGHPGPGPALPASWVDRMVLFNSPLPYDKERMAGMRTRPPAEASDYFVRQGTDPDGLAAELDTAEQAPPLHRHLLHVAGSGRHPGAFTVRGRRDGSARARSSTSTPSRSPTATSCGPASAGTRASFDGHGAQRADGDARPANDRRRCLILFGPSDHVIYPDVRPHGRRRVPEPRRPVPAPRLRSLRAVGSAARPGQRPRRVLRRPARVRSRCQGLIRPRRGCTIEKLPSREVRIPSSNWEVEMPSSTPETEEAPPD